jgi:membrane protein CcdC involved in cytochrome C biogenesis
MSNLNESFYFHFIKNIILNHFNLLQYQHILNIEARPQIRKYSICCININRFEHDFAYQGVIKCFIALLIHMHLLCKWLLAQFYSGSIQVLILADVCFFFPFCMCGKAGRK